jgi:alpha-beta hydrolase superfamily lysophospholipase
VTLHLKITHQREKFVVNTINGIFEGVDKTQLSYQLWMPETASRAILVIIHGICEHSGRYSNLIDGLVGKGFALASFNLRGHGRSSGKRGHINTWSDYRNDVAAFLKLLQEMHPDLPRFIYGHSLGSLIVLDFIIHSKNGLSGAILSSAPIEPFGVAKPHLVTIARLMSRIWPTFPVALNLDPQDISRDQSVVDAYRNDPQVFRTVTARWGTESMDTLELVKSNASKIQLPVLFIHGGDDPLHSVEGIRRYMQKIYYPDKKLIVYPDSLHEPHNDLDCHQVAVDIESWMVERIQ